MMTTKVGAISPPAGADAGYAERILALPNSDPERRRLWMQFLRSRTLTKSGANHDKKCPDEIREQICNGNNSVKEHYFNVWLRCNSDWGKASLFERAVVSHRETGRGKAMWLTEGQLVKMYKDPSVVAALIAAKRGTAQVRAHPEVPQCAAFSPA